MSNPFFYVFLNCPSPDRRSIARIIDASQFLDESQGSQGNETLGSALKLAPLEEPQMCSSEPTTEIGGDSRAAPMQPR